MILSLARIATDASPLRPENRDEASPAERKHIVTAAVAAILAS